MDLLFNRYRLPAGLLPNRVKVELPDDPSPVQRNMLLALTARGTPGYGGTVPPAEVARRRAANKRARISRRVNRRSR